MAFYSLKLFEIALELSQLDIDYLDLAERFLNYFFLVADSTNSPINQAGKYIICNFKTLILDLAKNIRVQAVMVTVSLFQGYIILECQGESLTTVSYHSSSIYSL